MGLLNLDLKTITYLQSEAEFHRARRRGFWVYFVQDGHHRVSVVSYLGWSTLQAYVTVWPSLPSGAEDLASQSQARKGDN